jgi:pimeloyl-ACP methyl ester carboxylesterase
MDAMTAGPVRLHYRVDHTGGPHTHRVALLHGVGGSLRTWDRVLKFFPLGFDVLRYDLRGHAQSDKPPGPYELSDFVTDHLNVLADANFAPCHLVGFSLGGLIAQAVALAPPENTLRLAIVSAIAGRTDDDRARVRERLETLRREGPAGMAEVSAERWYTAEFLRLHPAIVKGELERLAANDPEAYVAAYEVLATNDLLTELHRVTQPTLIVTGEHDVGSPPRMAYAMQHEMPTSDVVIMPDIKHELLVEVPERLAEIIVRFLLSE